MKSTLVVGSGGFNDRSRLDAFGHPHSDALRVVERFRRRDLGDMDVDITVEDPTMHQRPFTVMFVDRLIPDSDVDEFYCADNEKDRAHIPGKEPRIDRLFVIRRLRSDRSSGRCASEPPR
jgi:hypothetical protein